MVKKTSAKTGSVSSAGSVDLHEVERILDFMRKHGLAELEYERDGIRVFLKRASDSAAPSAVPAASAAASAASAVSAPPVSPAPAPSALASAPPSQPEAPADDVHVVKSPIVGTFYIAPSPDADPFVAIGTQVPVGKVLCIIEAMKLMNEIESEVAGEVVRIFVENGHPVEYGAPLFGIRPNRTK